MASKRLAREILPFSWLTGRMLKREKWAELSMADFWLENLDTNIRGHLFHADFVDV